MKPCLLAAALVACSSSRPDTPAPDGAVTPDAPALQDNWLPDGAFDLAADDTNLYLANGAEVVAAPLAGGAPVKLYEPTLPPNGFAMIGGLVVGATDLLFVTAVTDENGATTKTLYVVPKAGGTPLALATSQDSRAFLGATFDGDDVVYSSFTSVLRVAKTGGTPRYVGESEGSVQYWIFSPVAMPDAWLWTSEGTMYRLPRTSTDQTGHAFAELPETGEAIAHDHALVVALSPDIEYDGHFDAAIEVNPATGALGPRVPLGTVQAMKVAANADTLFAAGQDGLWRVPRTGGTPQQLISGFCLAVTATRDAAFAACGKGITRIAL